MKSSVEFSEIAHERIAERLRLFAYKNLSSFSRKSLSHFNHNLSMSFFDLKMGKKKFCDITQRISRKFKTVCHDLILSEFLLLRPFINRTTKPALDPFQYFIVVVTDLKKRVVVFVNVACCCRFGFKKTNEKAPFAINETCQITQVIPSKMHRTSFGLKRANDTRNKINCPA